MAVWDIVRGKHNPYTGMEEIMTPKLERFTQFARRNPKLKYNSLMGLLFREGGLRDSFRRLAGNKAPGVDGIRKVDYEKDLEVNIKNLSKRIQKLDYKPKPVRRVYIPKSSRSGRRPLGIPAFEDRIVQDRLSQILQAIWEPEFRNCSYGFRPGRGCHDALKRVDGIIMMERTQYVVEVDIKGFFNHVDHEWMVKFLSHRIADKRFIRILQRFLKSGVMEDGVLMASEEGTPQGGLVSPVLSNIYLHYVLDLWFEYKFAKGCRGKALFVRYCDDFIALFMCKADAERFLQEVQECLRKFSLEIKSSKTRLIAFGSRAVDKCKKEGLRRPSTFSFLGFTHFVTTNRKGRFIVGRKTDAERINQKLKEFKIRLKCLRTTGGMAMVAFAKRHFEGHLQYYGISGNVPSVRNYFHQAKGILFKWLNRRSQRRSLTWVKFHLLLSSKQFPKEHVIYRLYGHSPIIR